MRPTFRGPRSTVCRPSPGLVAAIPTAPSESTSSTCFRAGHAHTSFTDAIADFPLALRGVKPPGQPFTAWRLLEHIRISQWDIVEFTKSAKHVSPEWPAEYWPESDAPPAAAAWDRSVVQVERDLRAMQRLVRDPGTDLFARIPHGTGQTVLREALVLADHNSYHLG